MIDRSCSVPVVVAQETANSIPGLHFAADTSNFHARFDQAILKALVISFRVEMQKVLANRVAQRCFAEEDHPIEQFLAERPVKTFDVGVQVRASRRKEDWLNAASHQDRAKRPAELAVAIHEHIPLPDEEAVFEVGQVLAICVIQRPSGLGVQPAKWTRRVATSMTNSR